MSLAAGSYQCTFIPDAGTFTIALMGSTGDLVQMYNGTSSAPQSIMPSWDGLDAADRPVVGVVLMSSDASISQDSLADQINDAATKWYVNGEELEFNNAGDTINGSYDGLFTRINAKTSTANPYGGLRVNGNLVKAALGAPMVIKCALGIEVGTTLAMVQASYTIRILPISGDAAMADIYCDPGASFALDETNTSVVAKVRVWREGVLLDASDYDCNWSVMIDGEWVSRGSGATFTVTRDDIQTFGQIKVECMTTGSNPTLIASDIQTVSDSSDPYIVYPNPTPADGTLYQTGGAEYVEFAPTLQSMSGGSAPANVKYKFAVLSPAGVILNTDYNTVQQTYRVDKSVFVALNAGPLINITALETT